MDIGGKCLLVEREQQRVQERQRPGQPHREVLRPRGQPLIHGIRTVLVAPHTRIDEQPFQHPRRPVDFLEAVPHRVHIVCDVLLQSGKRRKHRLHLGKFRLPRLVVGENVFQFPLVLCIDLASLLCLHASSLLAFRQVGAYCLIGA